MKCQNCGAENNNEAVFCSECGSKIEVVEVQQPVVAKNPKSHKSVFIICGIIVAVVIIGIAGLLVYQQTQSGKLKLDEETIKDATVRTTFTTQFDSDGDGVLSKEELASVDTIETSDVTDASWLPYFTNIKTFKITQSSVSEVNFYDNRNLTKIDVSGAKNLDKVTFPDSGEFIDITLPDKEGIETVFPPTSKMELQHVPITVQTPSVTYKQDAESVVKVNKLDKQGEQTNYSYGTCVINSISKTRSQANLKSQLKRDDTGKIVQDVNNYANNISAKYTCEYDSSGNVTAVGKDLINKLTYVDNSIVLNSNNGSADYVVKSWVLNSEKKPTRFFTKFGNGSTYQLTDYTWQDGKLSTEKISFYEQTSSSTKVEDMKLGQSIDVNFTYDDDDRLVKSEFSNGCTQSFVYEGDVLTSVTTSNAPDSGTYVLALPKNGKTEIKYKSFIGIKGRTPLSFIKLPGVGTDGIVNLDASDKTMSLYGSYDGVTAMDESFNGKFWWDEEDVVGYQRELATLKGQSTEEPAAEEDSSYLLEEKKAELRQQGYSVYEGKTEILKNDAGKNIYCVRFNTPSEIQAFATGIETPAKMTVNVVAISDSSGVSSKIEAGTPVLLAAKKPYEFYYETSSADYYVKSVGTLKILNEGLLVNLNTMEEVKGN